MKVLRPNGRPVRARAAFEPPRVASPQLTVPPGRSPDRHGTAALRLIKELVHRGGINADILGGGTIAVGDRVRVREASASSPIAAASASPMQAAFVVAVELAVVEVVDAVVELCASGGLGRRTFMRRR